MNPGVDTIRFLAACTAGICFLALFKFRRPLIRKLQLGAAVAFAIPQSLLCGVVILMVPLTTLVLAPVFFFTLLLFPENFDPAETAAKLLHLYLNTALLFGILTVNWLMIICRIRRYQQPKAPTPESAFVTTRVLLVCGGFLGLHWFYLGKPLRGILYFLTVGFLGLGVVMDLSRLEGGQLSGRLKKPVPKKSEPPPLPARPVAKPMPRWRQIINQQGPFFFAVLIFGVLPALHFLENFSGGSPIWGICLAVGFGTGFFFATMMVLTMIGLCFHPGGWRLILKVPLHMWTFPQRVLRKNSGIDFRVFRKTVKQQALKVQTPCFELWTDSDRSELPGLCQEIFQRSLEATREWTGISTLTAPESLRLIACKSHQDLSRYLRNLCISQPCFAGLYLPGSPPRILISLEWADLYPGDLENTLSHEFVHAIHLHGGGVSLSLKTPVWILEGISQHVSHMVAPVRLKGITFLHHARDLDALLSGKEMLTLTHQNPDPCKKCLKENPALQSRTFLVQCLYLQSRIWIHWLHRNCGSALMKALFETPPATPEAFTRLFGVDPDNSMARALEEVFSSSPHPGPPPAAAKALESKIIHILRDPKASRLEQHMALSGVFVLEPISAGTLLENFRKHCHRKLRREADALIAIFSRWPRTEHIS